METMRYHCVLSSKKACVRERAKSRTKGDTPDTNTYSILVSFSSFSFFVSLLFLVCKFSSCVCCRACRRGLHCLLAGTVY